MLIICLNEREEYSREEKEKVREEKEKNVNNLFK